MTKICVTCQKLPFVCLFLCVTQLPQMKFKTYKLFRFLLKTLNMRQNTPKICSSVFPRTNELYSIRAQSNKRSLVLLYEMIFDDRSFVAGYGSSVWFEEHQHLNKTLNFYNRIVKFSKQNEQNKESIVLFELFIVCLTLRLIVCAL